MKKNKTATKKRPVLISVISVASVLIIGGLILGYLYLGQGLTGQTILENVTVAGVDVGGMTKWEAASAVRNATKDTYTEVPMVVRVNEDTISLAPEISGAILDVDAAIDLAYAYGRSDDPAQNAAVQVQAMTSGIEVDILDCLGLHTDLITAELEKLTKPYDSTLTQPSYIVSGVDGMDKSVIVTLGTPGYDLTFAGLYDQVMAAYNRNQFSVDMACTRTEPDEVDLDAIYKETLIEAVDAKYDTQTQTITEHVLGYAFDLAEAKEKVAKAQYGQSITIAYNCVKPETTKDQLDGMLFRDVLSTYTAKSGSASNRDVNLRLACQAVNGVVLQPGEIFDYNETLGERTSEKGYKYGASYIGNKTVSTIGGGICQVSSTIYYCALMADMEIVTRVNHGFLNTYVPMGMDATVSWGGPEFRFKNNSDYPIRIEASSDAGNVTVTIKGTDVKDYYVKMEYTVLATYPWERVEVEMPADNPDGYKDGQVISTAYTGYRVVTYRCKYDKQTDELISKEQETMNTYNKRDYQIAKIVTQETTPPTTTPPVVEDTTPTTPPTQDTTPPTQDTTPPEEEQPPVQGGSPSEDI